MAEPLLAGLTVVDLTGEPGQWCGRILADLGADVVKIEPFGGDPLRELPSRFAALNAGKAGATDPRPYLEAADAVLTTPGWPGTPELDPGMAPQAAPSDGGR